jgi:hypothetical protein
MVHGLRRERSHRIARAVAERAPVRVVRIEHHRMHEPELSHFRGHARRLSFLRELRPVRTDDREPAVAIFTLDCGQPWHRPVTIHARERPHVHQRHMPAERLDHERRAEPLIGRSVRERRQRLPGAPRGRARGQRRARDSRHGQQRQRGGTSRLSIPAHSPCSECSVHPNSAVGRKRLQATFRASRLATSSGELSRDHVHRPIEQRQTPTRSMKRASSPMLHRFSFRARQMRWPANHARRAIVRCTLTPGDGRGRIGSFIRLSVSSGSMRPTGELEYADDNTRPFCEMMNSLG